MIENYDKAIEDGLCKDRKSEIENLIESVLQPVLVEYPKMDEKEKKEQ